MTLPDDLRPVLFAALSTAIDDKQRHLDAVNAERGHNDSAQRKEARQLTHDIAAFRAAQIAVAQTTAPPTPLLIKLHNTEKLVRFLEDLCDVNGLQPSTRAGAALTIYVNAVLLQARQESTEIARRNLTRALTLLTQIRDSATAAEMEQRAADATRQHNTSATKGDTP